MLQNPMKKAKVDDYEITITIPLDADVWIAPVGTWCPPIPPPNAPKIDPAKWGWVQVQKGSDNA